MIVAGPWLLSVLGIFTINRVAASALSESSQLFTASIGYSFAGSLMLFGGFHYVYTRHVADLIYEKRFTDSCSVLVVCLVATAVVSASIALFATAPMDLSVVSRPGLFKAAAAGVFVTIHLIWVLMIFASLLKRYLLILVGMTVSTLRVVWLGGCFRVGRAMLGFARGQLLIALTLMLLIWREYPPHADAIKDILRYFGRQ